MGKNQSRGKGFLKIIEYFIAREVKVSKNILPSQLD